MKLLVLGGTRFVGRHVVEAAITGGHDVTLFNRGRSAPGLFGDTVEELRGNRETGDLAALRGRRFDAIVDASAYRPCDVAGVLNALAHNFDVYAFISTVSVYAEPIALGSDESAPVIELADGIPLSGDSVEAYGGLKACCERLLPPHALVVRPGVVAGPYDPTERVTRWARRAGEGDNLLAAAPEQPVQFIDARDLASFLLEGIARDLTGIFNVVTEPVPFSAFLDAAGAGDRVVWAGRERLAAAGVALWDELPMTAPREDEAFLTFSSARARAAGLRTRPVAETLTDVRAWDATRPPGERSDPLPRRREIELLGAL